MVPRSCVKRRAGVCGALFAVWGGRSGVWRKKQRGVAQLAEHWFPKPAVAGSSPSAPVPVVELLIAKLVDMQQCVSVWSGRSR